MRLLSIALSGTARLLPLALLIAAPVTLAACASEDDGEDLGSVIDGKGDGALIDVSITVPKRSTSGSVGVRNYTVRSTSDFDVSLDYEGTQGAKLTVTNLDSGEKVESSVGPRATVSVPGTGEEVTFKIRVENHSTTTLRAKLRALGHGGGGVTPALLAAARANLDRITKEIDYTHLNNYDLSGSLTDQFMSALSAEYETQHRDQYVARVKALASMIFFALPDVAPPEGGKPTPFHGLDMDQFDALMDVEDAIFGRLTQLNNNDTNGVRPFSVCETRYIIETYVRPRVTFPGFDAHKTGYTAYAASCPQKDKDDWYNFRGLGGLRPSWVESNLADRFLRRMAKTCKNPTSSWTAECAKWNADRMGYRQAKNKELAARTMFYAPADEAHLINPNNPLVLIEDRNGDGIGEFLKPGSIKLKNGDMGTLQVNSTGQFTGNLKFQPMTGTLRTVSPGELVAADAVDSRWNPNLLAKPDMGLMTVFSSSTGCTGASIDPAQCPLMRRFYSMIDRHENFYQTFSALQPTYYGISSQPSPLVACSITLAASHAWDSAGTPPGGRAGFIYLMRIPFKDILTGNDKSVATIMPGPKTTSLQSLYAGTSSLDFSSLWLDIASLSNNLYESEHEISAFGAVRADQIEGILVVRKPAAIPSSVLAVVASSRAGVLRRSGKNVVRTGSAGAVVAVVAIVVAALAAVSAIATTSDDIRGRANTTPSRCSTCESSSRRGRPTRRCGRCRP
ncbi:MAG TPA: hypothetical protein VIV11_22915 [Kofleriaceae bacterium]